LNEDLAELHPLARLLFAGLWTLADRRGRLPDRPKRIKVEVLPYDDVDVNSLLDDLGAHGFILRYATADGQRYIQVVTFDKHQTPHVKEAESSIPAPNESGASPMLVAQAPETNTGPAPPDLGSRSRNGIGDPDPPTTSDLVFSNNSNRTSGHQAAPTPSLLRENEILNALGGLRGWPNAPGRAYDRLKVREWQKLYPSLDLLQELSGVDSWLAAKPQLGASHGLVSNWLKRAAAAAPPTSGNLSDDESIIGADGSVWTARDGAYAAGFGIDLRVSNVTGQPLERPLEDPSDDPDAWTARDLAHAASLGLDLRVSNVSGRRLGPAPVQPQARAPAASPDGPPDPRAASP
jgi:hypothetical protein